MSHCDCFQQENKQFVRFIYCQNSFPFIAVSFFFRKLHFRKCLFGNHTKYIRNLLIQKINEKDLSSDPPVVFASEKFCSEFCIFLQKIWFLQLFCKKSDFCVCKFHRTFSFSHFLQIFLVSFCIFAFLQIL